MLQLSGSHGIRLSFLRRTGTAPSTRGWAARRPAAAAACGEAARASPSPREQPRLTREGRGARRGARAGPCPPGREDTPAAPRAASGTRGRGLCWQRSCQPGPFIPEQPGASGPLFFSHLLIKVSALKRGWWRWLLQLGSPRAVAPALPRRAVPGAGGCGRAPARTGRARAGAPALALAAGLGRGALGSSPSSPGPGKDTGAPERDPVPGRRPLAEQQDAAAPAQARSCCAPGSPSCTGPCPSLARGGRLEPRQPAQEAPPAGGAARPGRRTKHTHAGRGGSLNILLFLVFKMANKNKKPTAWRCGGHGREIATRVARRRALAGTGERERWAPWLRFWHVMRKILLYGAAPPRPPLPHGNSEKPGQPRSNNTTRTEPGNPPTRVPGNGKSPKPRVSGAARGGGAAPGAAASE